MFSATRRRHLVHQVAWMVLITVYSAAVRSAPDYILPGSGRTIPVPVIRAAVLGTFKGSFSDCAASRGFTLQLSEGTAEDPQDLGLKGTLETFDTSGSTSTSQQISWAVSGRAEGISAYVSLHAVAPPVCEFVYFICLNASGELEPVLQELEYDYRQPLTPETAGNAQEPSHTDQYCPMIPFGTAKRPWTEFECARSTPAPKRNDEPPGDNQHPAEPDRRTGRQSIPKEGSGVSAKHRA